MNYKFEGSFNYENKHLSFEDRLNIEKELMERKSFKEITKSIDKNCTTVSRKIKNHYVTVDTGVIGRIFNNCLLRKIVQIEEKTVVSNIVVNSKKRLATNY